MYLGGSRSRQRAKRSSIAGGANFLGGSNGHMKSDLGRALEAAAVPKQWFLDHWRRHQERAWLGAGNDRLPASTRTRRLRKKRAAILRKHWDRQVGEVTRDAMRQAWMDGRRFSMLPPEEQVRRFNESLEERRLVLEAKTQRLEQEIAEA